MFSQHLYCTNPVVKFESKTMTVFEKCKCPVVTFQRLGSRSFDVGSSLLPSQL